MLASHRRGSKGWCGRAAVNAPKPKRELGGVNICRWVAPVRRPNEPEWREVPTCAAAAMARQDRKAAEVGVGGQRYY
eukprot:scaffold20532_cov123-Isochrysis_galbana.AAC.2